MKAAVSILLALGCVASPVLFGQTNEDQLEQDFRAGQQALQQHEFERAAAEFKKVLALDPSLVEAQVNLGLAYQSLLDYESATRLLAKALRAKPTLLGPTVIVGIDYLKLGSPEKAIPFLEHALQLAPSTLEAREALASSYLAEDNMGKAADQYRQIAALKADKAGALFKLGHEYLDLAARLAYRGARLYPESAWGHRFLGDLLVQRGRWKDAADEYAKALAAEPSQPGLHALTGEAYLHAGKLEDAASELHRELQLDAQSEAARLGLADLQLQRGQVVSALALLKEIWTISPEFLALQRDFPSVELSPQVAKNLLPDVQVQPDGAVKQFLLAALLAAGNESAAADRAWQSFQRDFSANAAVHTHSDHDPCRARRYALCIETLQSRKHPTDADRLLMGKTYFTLQKYQPAADILAQIQGVTRENAEGSYWLTRTYLAQGAEAYAHLQESFPDSWRTHQLRAEERALRQDFDGAVKEFQLALQLRPNEPELHEALGDFYLEHQENEEAQTELEKAFELDPSHSRTLSSLGRLYLQERENQKAVAALESALRLEPSLTEASSLLGTAYLRSGQYANAVPRLEKAAAVDHYGNVHYELYQAYRKLGQTDRAQKALARSQALRRGSLEHDQALVLGSPPPAPESQ